MQVEQDCSTYEVSENPAFPDDNTTTRLPCVAGNRSFTLSAGDEVKTVYARILDTAGNISSVLSDTIELDTEDNTRQYHSNENRWFKWRF